MNMPELETTTNSSKTDRASNEEYLQKSKIWAENISIKFQKITVLLAELFRAYKSILIAVGVFLGIAIALYLGNEFLKAIEEIPLLRSVLQLVGLGYIIWFVYRHLLDGKKRTQTLSNLKDFTNNSIDNITGSK